MFVPSTSWEVQMQLVDVLRKHIDKLRELKLEATTRRDTAASPDERRKFEELRCLLSTEERRQVRIYGELVPAEMLKVN